MEVHGRIYGLHEPTTGELRYLGQTILPLKRRLCFHCCPSLLKARTYRSNWIRSLLERGQRPEIRLRAEAWTKEELDQLEVEHIARARAQGTRLVNQRAGGHFVPDGHYQRLANMKRGVPRSIETRAKISATKQANPCRHRAGVKHTDAAKALISQSRRGKHMGDVHHNRRRDISTGLILQRLTEGFMKVEIAKELGVSPTFVHRRIAEARRAGKSIPKVQRKAWNKGQPLSPEHYANWYAACHGGPA